MCVISLTMILRKEKIGYRFSEESDIINHSLFMDDLKLYGENDSDIKNLLNIVHEFSKDIKMEFGIEKCLMKENSYSTCHVIKAKAGADINRARLAIHG